MKRQYLLANCGWSFLFIMLLMIYGCGNEAPKALEQWTSLTYWKTVGPDEVRDGLKAGMDANITFENGYNPLIMAAFFNKSPEVLEVLIEAGASLKVARGGMSPLMAAVSKNPNPEIVKLLLKHGAAVNEKGINGITPILLAADTCANIDVFMLLVEAQADLSATLSSGESIAALAMKNVGAGKQIREYLDQAGVKVFADNAKAIDSLVNLCVHGSITKVAAMIKAGISLNRPDSMGRLPLITALTADKLNIGLIRLLLENGADPSMTNESDDNAIFAFLKKQFAKNALMFSEAYNQDKKALNIGKHQAEDVENHYVPRCPDFQNLKLLKEAFYQVLALFKERQIDLASRDYLGNTPLHIAAKGGDKELVNYLQVPGIDLFTENNAGDTLGGLLLARCQQISSLYEELAAMNISLTNDTANDIATAFTLLRNSPLLHNIFVTIWQKAPGRVNKDGSNLFFAAVSNPHCSNKTLESILTKGYDINGTDNLGRTPIMAGFLGDNGQNHRVTWLILQGANIHQIDNTGKNVFHYYAMNSQAPFLKIAKPGTDSINDRDQMGRTPLITALLHRQYHAVTELIKAGANILIADKNQQTALDFDQHGYIYKLCQRKHQKGLKDKIPGFEQTTPYQLLRLMCVPVAEEPTAAESFNDDNQIAISRYAKRHSIEEK